MNRPKARPTEPNASVRSCTTSGRSISMWPLSARPRANSTPELDAGGTELRVEGGHCLECLLDPPASAGERTELPGLCADLACTDLTHARLAGASRPRLQAHHEPVRRLGTIAHLIEQHRLADATQTAQHDPATGVPGPDPLDDDVERASSRSRPTKVGGRSPEPGSKGLSAAFM